MEKLLKVDIAAEHISTSHRLPAKRKLNDDKDLVPRPIIARFISRDIRNRIYTNRNFTRTADLESFFIEGTKQIFINENLTLHRKKLFWKAKQTAKRLGYKFFGRLTAIFLYAKQRLRLQLLVRVKMIFVWLSNFVFFQVMHGLWLFCFVSY